MVGRPDDPHALRVVDELGARGVRVLLLDLAPFPVALSLSLEDGVPRYRGIDLSRAGACYVRSIHMRLPFFDVAVEAERGASGRALVESWQARYLAERERQSFFAAFLLALERAGVAMINPVSTIDQHFVKLDQLAILRAVGVPVPRTIGTNDREELRRFAEKGGDALVAKALAGGELCRRVAAADLSRPGALRPAIFQEEVPGRDIRVYVVGGAVVAAYEVEGEGVDYREPGSVRAARPLDVVPPGLAETCIRAARACGMEFTGIDVRYTDDRRFCVLECNPSPMFEGFERSGADMRVTRALADLVLVRVRARRDQLVSG